MALLILSGPIWASLHYVHMLVLLALAGILYFALLSIYRVTLHPLAKYPGRFLDKFSSWPLVMDCYSGERHLRVQKLHDKYGSIVRVAPNMLSLNTVDAMHAIYGNPKANTRKSNWYKTIDAGSGEYSTQSVIDKKVHAFRRRVISPAFSEKALRDAEKYINANVEKLMSRLGEGAKDGGWSEPRNFAQWSIFYSFDFISDLSFGSSLNLLDNEENRFLPSTLMGTSKFLYYAGYLPFNPLVNLFLMTGAMNYFPDRTVQDTARFFQMSEAKLEEREALEEQTLKATGKPPPRRDIFHYLLYSRDPETGKGFTRSQLHADSGLLIAAGSDGVSIMLSAALFYLLSNPSTLGKLTHEIRSRFTSTDEIGLPKLNALPYLQAVIDEAMRMSPPIPSALPRRTLPGGITVDGSHIPGGIEVGVPAYSLHHNEAYFPDSYRFSPERWLLPSDKDGDTAAAERLSLARKAFCPFSLGPFNCIGKSVAYLSVKLVLAKMLFVYDVRNVGGKFVGAGGPGKGEGREREGEYQMVDWLVGYRDGPVVQFRRRDGLNDG